MSSDVERWPDDGIRRESHRDAKHRQAAMIENLDPHEPTVRSPTTGSA